MKKFFTILVILFAIFLFRTKIIDFTYGIKDYIKTTVFDIREDSTNNDANNSENNENNLENNNINNSSGNNISYENYTTIKLGESLQSIKLKLGQPDNIEKSEYEFDWYVYNSDYNYFCMVGILNDKVVSLFSNTMNSDESENIKLGDIKSEVLKNYKQEKYRLKENVRYVINEDYYSLIKTNSSYITVFYDSFDNNKTTGIQIISKEVEESTTGIHSKDSSITSDFENINRYLINSERVARGLNKLSYDENATLCARSHSEDMRDNNFFNHTNLKSQTPFDRMSSYGINYKAAAENIAAGQTSSIFAHYALMNSKGHRVNILGDYYYVGVGIVFGGSSNLYLTQNFYK